MEPIRFISQVTWSFHIDQENFIKWPPHSWIRPDSTNIILKTRIIGLLISFRLRQFFATLQVDIISYEIVLKDASLQYLLNKYCLSYFSTDIFFGEKNFVAFNSEIKLH